MGLRIGALAAARIVPGALIAPAKAVDGVEVTAVAARDHERADEAARTWGVPTAVAGYDALLDRDDVDAVYIATPNSLHVPWAVRAIEAGKHVLLEKPLSSNAADGERLLADAAARPDVVVMEAFHSVHHPLFDDLERLLASGTVGAVRRVKARFTIPADAMPPGDIRWQFDLAGGALMDLGVYPIGWSLHLLARLRGDVTLPVVEHAKADCPVTDVDGTFDATLRWADTDVTAEVHASMTADAFSAELVVHGDDGIVRAINPLAPQRGGRLLVERDGAATEHAVDPTPTYTHQLRVFRDAVILGRDCVTDVADGLRRMTIIDACYRAAGLPVRPTDPTSLDPTSST